MQDTEAPPTEDTHDLSSLSEGSESDEEPQPRISSMDRLLGGILPDDFWCSSSSASRESFAIAGLPAAWRAARNRSGCATACHSSWAVFHSTFLPRRGQ